MGNDAGSSVRRKQASIEVDQAAECRESKLPRLQDDVERCRLVEEIKLRLVRLELDLDALLIRDPVKVGQSPARV